MLDEKNKRDESNQKTKNIPYLLYFYFVLQQRSAHGES